MTLLFAFVGHVRSYKPKSKHVDNYCWHSLDLELGGAQEITVLNFKESLIFSKWTDTSVTRDNKKEWFRIHEKRRGIKINKVEKDSLLKWTKNLMKPVTPTGWCTDYVGYLLVRVNYGNRSTRTEQSCKY